MLQNIKLAVAKNKFLRRAQPSSIVFNLPIQTAVLLIDSKNMKALPDLLTIKQELKIVDSKFQLVVCKEKYESFPELNGLTFANEDLNFLGNFRKKELLNLTENNFDLLITFAERSNVAVNLLAARCRAGLKLGNDPGNESTLDVVIKFKMEVGIFTSEVMKFLNRIKKIKNE